MSKGRRSKKKNRKTLDLQVVSLIIISILLAILICLLGNIDIFPVVGITLQVPFIGAGLTGIIVSRGANFVNDLFSKINNKEEK